MRVCAVQLNLKHCADYASFVSYLQKEVFDNLLIVPDLLVFPENINLCLLFAKKDKSFETKNFKTFIELVFDKFIRLFDLSFLLRWFDIDNQRFIILKAFSYFAKEYNTNIIVGTYYHSKQGKIYNSVSMIDSFGFFLGEVHKKKLTGFEKALKLGVQENPVIVETSVGNIGLSICYDINYPDYIKSICDLGADIVVCPSNGWRPFPGYPYDPKKEKPHIDRAKEKNVIVIRPYCAGWLFPLYFQGHTEIIDGNGNLLNRSYTYNRTELVISEINKEV
jgi:predicted amidohydrolase